MKERLDYSPEKRELLEKKIEIFKNQLYWCFKGTYDGMISIDKLYEKGLRIRKDIELIISDFWDRQNLQDIKDAIEFIESLNDSKMREYYSKNKEEIYYHIRRLS